MKTFPELNFKEHYDSQKDNLLNDFYIPALANSKKYRRVVGYFNSKSLASVALGLKDFILNNGKMDLLCGVDLNPQDVNMVNFASEHPEEITSLHNIIFLFSSFSYKQILGKELNKSSVYSN